MNTKKFHKPSKFWNWMLMIVGGILGNYIATSSKVDGSMTLVMIVVGAFVGYNLIHWLFETEPKSAKPAKPHRKGSVFLGWFFGSIGFGLGLLVGFGYLAWPIDIIPDVIPGLGWVDDAVAVIALPLVFGWVGYHIPNIGVKNKKLTMDHDDYPRLPPE